MANVVAWLYHGLAWTWGGAPFLSGAAGYNIMSGPLPDSLFIGGIAHVWRRHNCHVKRCWRLQWHIHPDTGHPVCKHHHPDET